MRCVTLQAYFEKVANLSRILWFIDPYQYHPLEFDSFPWENQLSNCQVARRIQTKSCAVVSNEQVYMCV